MDWDQIVIQNSHIGFVGLYLAYLLVQVLPLLNKGFQELDNFEIRPLTLPSIHLK